MKIESTGDVLTGCDNVNASNVLIMSGTKKKISREKAQGKRKGGSKMKKQEQRRLKKLQEMKEEKARLAEIYKTLEEHKTSDDLRHLLYSSRNIGQMETMRERLKRAMRLSRAGLDVPADVPLFKKRRVASFCYDEADMEIKSVDDIVKLSVDDIVKPSIERDEHNDVPVLTGAETSTSRLSDSAKMANKLDKMSETVSKSFSCVTSQPQRSREDDLDEPIADHHQDPAPRVFTTNGEKEIKQEITSYKHQTLIPEPSSQCKTSLSVLPAEKSFHVHVMRPIEVEEKRSQLPIVMMEQEIMESIYENTSVIICGETGCGKTTQVPQFLYEAGFGSPDCHSRQGAIGVTQPRRVAVRATAKRVAYEMGFEVGKQVGFQVRHDKQAGKSSSIKFMTDGILLREIQSDFLLRHYSVIILDEAHERSVNTDILIGMLSRIIKLRQHMYEEQQRFILSGRTIKPEDLIRNPLKLILMSATLRVEDFASNKKLFPDPLPVVEVPARQFPVTIHFSRRTRVDYVCESYKMVLKIHEKLPAGGILVFLTGEKEIKDLCKKLQRRNAASRKKLLGRKLNAGVGALSVSEETVDNMKAAIDSEDYGLQNQSDDPRTCHSTYEVDSDDHSVDPEFDDESDIESDDNNGDEQHDDNDDEDDDDESESDNESRHVLEDPDCLESLKAAFEALDSNPSQKNPNEKKSCQKDIQVQQSFTPLYVLPLYAMLDPKLQSRVFRDVPEGERLVVVATNVAETSLTIPGIKYVVDPGKEKVKHYNFKNGIASYQVQWISKASAEQRAGRAGRIGPGHCYRLYSSAVFNDQFADFSEPAIRRESVEGIYLTLKSMDIDKVANFPFPTPPEDKALAEAERCLTVVEALDSYGKLTSIGKAMVHYPISPRHSRMLLTVVQQISLVGPKRKEKLHHGRLRPTLVLAFAAAAAAALSCMSPFLMQLDADSSNHGEMSQGTKRDKEEKKQRKQQIAAAKAAHEKFCNPTSDALTVANALKQFEREGNSSEFCASNSLNFKSMEEMSNLRKQLLGLIFHCSSKSKVKDEFSWTYGDMKDLEREWKSTGEPLSWSEEAVLAQAIAAGWPDRIARRIKRNPDKEDKEKKVRSGGYQACMLDEVVYLHRRSSVSRYASEFVVYNELVHTSRPYMHGMTIVKPQWLVRHARPLCSFSSPIEDRKPFYDPITDQVYCWVNVTFGPHLWDLPLHYIPSKDAKRSTSVFAYALLKGQVLPCFKSVQKCLALSPSIILKPKAEGQPRVGLLLDKLRSASRFRNMPKPIPSRGLLREAWEDDHEFLYSEIKIWFQDTCHDDFEKVWKQMHEEILLDVGQLFPERLRRGMT